MGRRGNPNWVPGKSGNPATMWKPGERGLNTGARHAVECRNLIEQHNLDEEMALLAARQGKYKRVPFRDQISAYEKLRDSAYGKPAAIQVANVNEVQFVKRIVGVDQDKV
jgi:hypothetical protein